MKKSVLDNKDIVRYQKQVFTTSDVRYIEGNLVVKLHGQNIDAYFFFTRLTLNEDDNNFEEQYNDINYRKTVKILHDDG